MNFTDATPQEIDSVLKEAQVAFLSYKNLTGAKKAAFLRAIADAIDTLGAELIQTAMRETHLPEARLVGERARTTGQLKMFAQLVEEGSWCEARIDTALPDRMPVPKPDLRKMLVPVGPVVVFGAANFPFAYSTAGGDTASALAAGCPVIVKAHPAHAATSQLVADAIQQAAEKTGMPKAVFQHVHGRSFAVGHALVKHPFTKAVGFTGSLSGGKALFDLANQRPEPIPVFAEMSSINPVVLLPNTLNRDAVKTAEKIAASVVLGVGQFCTNPGLIITVDGAGLQKFLPALSQEFKKALPGTMLHPGIADNYSSRKSSTLAQKGVNVEGEGPIGTEEQGQAMVASVAARDFLANPALAEEVFGPFSLIIKCGDRHELNNVVAQLHGQLTVTIIGDEAEAAEYQSVFNLLAEKAGRVVMNGVPTGVEVCPAMQHGGPFPSTTDSRFTSVGTDAIKRFVRPLAFQNFPDSLLPEALKEQNPLKIWRLRNGEWGKN